MSIKQKKEEKREREKSRKSRLNTNRTELWLRQINRRRRRRRGKKTPIQSSYLLSYFDFKCIRLNQGYICTSERNSKVDMESFSNPVLFIVIKIESVEHTSPVRHLRQYFVDSSIDRLSSDHNLKQRLCLCRRQQKEGKK